MAEIKNNDFTIGAISASGSISSSTSTSGITRSVSVSNSDNTSLNSIAKFIATVGGDQAGDPFTTYTVTGFNSWSHGLSNDTDDEYRIITGTDLTSGTIATQITTAAVLSYPNQPAFLAFLQNNVTNATGSGTAYTVAFDQIQFERGGSNFNTTTGVYTIPAGAGGIYLFTYTLNMEAIGAAVIEGTATILTTARTYRGYVGNPFAMSGAGTLGLQASVIAEMAPTDTAEIVVTFSGDAADNVTVSQVSSQFSGWKLG